MTFLTWSSAIEMSVWLNALHSFLLTLPWSAKSKQRVGAVGKSTAVSSEEVRVVAMGTPHLLQSSGIDLLAVG